MSRSEFVERYRNELAGMVADAATVRCGGGELAIKLRSWFTKIDNLLGQAYDSLQSEETKRPTIALNGHQKAKVT